MDSTIVEKLDLGTRELEIREESQVCDQNNKPSEIVAEHESIRGQVFTCFERLPLELKERVWQFSMTPRIIEIYVAVRIDSEEPSDFWAASYQVYCHTKGQPVVNRVCRSSRNLFLREHFVLRQDHIGNKDLLPMVFANEKRPLIYVNHLIDTVYIDEFPDTMMFQLLPRNLHARIAMWNPETAWKWAIRSLTFNSEILEDFREQPSTLSFFDGFPALEELVFLEEPAGFDGGKANQIWNSEDMGWERVMSEVGYFRHNKLHDKFSSLKITVSSMFLSGTHDIEDCRQGLFLMGPPNQAKDWILEDKKV